MPDLSLSVIVPAHNSASTLSDCLNALLESDLPKAQWELIVVDDGSTDNTSEIAARLADKFLATGEQARGPAFARNRGADAADSPILAFVDADVSVHPDALRLMIEAIRPESGFTAVFGSYDDEPRAPSMVSQYRNLLHHYVHNRSAGETATFWAGCGAVKKEMFERVGKFDERRYTRPQIEDIELGYRLRAAGARILIDPGIECTHHKDWKALSMMRTDLLDRAIPWVRLLLSSPPPGDTPSPSLGRGEVIGAAAVAATVLVAVFALVRPSPVALMVLVACFGIVLWLHRDLYRWFLQIRGVAFAARAVPLHLSYKLVSAVAVPLGVGLHLTDASQSTQQKIDETNPPRIFSPEYYQRMRDLEANAWWNAGMRDIAAALLANARLPQQGLMVDAGCGSGQTMSWFLSSHPKWRCWGGDVAMEGVRAAASFGLSASQADVTQLPLRDSTADLVVSFDVLQHLSLATGDAQALNEFFRVLKPGGYLLLRTNSQSWPKTVDDDAYNFRKYQPEMLEARLKESGFMIDYLSRANAILGLAEIAREMRATRETGHGYHGLLANARHESTLGRSLKRGILRAEGSVIASGIRLPLGRSIMALCHKPLHDKSGQTATS